MEKGHDFLQNDGAQGPFPSRQLCWLEMALSSGDRCHSLLIGGGPAQLSRTGTELRHVFQQRAGKGDDAGGQPRVDVTPKCG